VSGVLIGAVVFGDVSVLLFGPTLPNVIGQSDLLTALSFPNLLGLVLGTGGATHALLTAMELLVLAVLAWQLAHGRDWLAAAGWVTAALIISLGSLMPWYVVWLLPLAGLARDGRLRATALVLTAFAVVTFCPSPTTTCATTV
jgi:membrane-bound metal-dependent hydrolase YbcI (DUF457 family)